MSSNQFVKYRSFDDRGLATQLYQQLTDAGLTVQWDDSEKQFDVSFVNNELLNWYYIKLRPQDFKKADEVLMHYVEERYEAPAKDYYLYSFSDAELIDILQKPDEWSIYDCYWAQKILADRGITIDNEVVEKLKTNRITELKKPWKLGWVWVILTITILLYSLGVMHFAWSIVCIISSFYVSFSKKTLPDGQRVDAFTKSDRKLALILTIVSVIVTIIIFMVYFGLLPLPTYL